MLKFVGIGGGTGLSVLLRGLKQLSDGSREGTQGIALNLSAIVCVSDNGGSTGYLRQNFGIPAVGDLRNCLVALAAGDPRLAELFQFRFAGGSDLGGHSLGNLIVTALLQMSGSLGQAIEMAREVLHTIGCVLPVTESALTLCAELESGNVIRGESQITAAHKRIKRVWLEPHSPPPAAGVLQAISRADAIILGPGSLYTSIVPNLLVEGVADAVRNSAALKIFVCNLMTQPGETDGFTATDHLGVLQSYLGPGALDLCVLNSQPVPAEAEETYLESKSVPVIWNQDEIARMRVTPVAAALLADGQTWIRHDAGKLASLIVSLTRGIQRTRDILSGRESTAA